jgi:hypothetical protein
MKEEFVTYEQAVALTELGCYGPLRFYSAYLNLTEREIFIKISDNSRGYFSVPTKSQVFRWFREKYNQNSFIELVYQDGVKYDYVLYVDKDEEECGNFGDGPFKTYEEAENACIYKLIEIVKSKLS